MKNKKIVIITAIIITGGIIAGSVIGISNYKNNSMLKEADELHQQESYEEAVALYKQIGGKKNADRINKKIAECEIIITSQNNYNEAIKLFNDKNYVKAMELFDKVGSSDTKNYSLAKGKIIECKTKIDESKIIEISNYIKNNDLDKACIEIKGMYLINEKVKEKAEQLTIEIGKKYLIDTKKEIAKLEKDNNYSKIIEKLEKIINIDVNNEEAKKLLKVYADKKLVYEKKLKEMEKKQEEFESVFRNLDNIITTLANLDDEFSDDENWYNSKPVITNAAQSALNNLETMDVSPIAIVFILEGKYSQGKTLAEISRYIHQQNSELTKWVRRSYFPPEGSNWNSDISKAKNNLSKVRVYIQKYNKIKKEVLSGKIY